jgi:hypothetical protein
LAFLPEIVRSELHGQGWQLINSVGSRAYHRFTASSDPSASSQWKVLASSCQEVIRASLCQGVFVQTSFSACCRRSCGSTRNSRGWSSVDATCFLCKFWPTQVLNACQSDHTQSEKDQRERDRDTKRQREQATERGGGGRQGETWKSGGERERVGTMSVPLIVQNARAGARRTRRCSRGAERSCRRERGRRRAPGVPDLSLSLPPCLSSVSGQPQMSPIQQVRVPCKCDSRQTTVTSNLSCRRARRRRIRMRIRC